MEGLFKNYKVKPVDSIKSEVYKIKRVSEMYGELQKDIIKDGCLSYDSFEKAYIQMVKIEKLLYSKKGIKKGIVNCLLKNTPVNTMIHPLKVKDDYKIDYLNLKRNEWQDPSSEISYNKSVIDLICEAKEEVQVWEKIVCDYYKNKGDISELNKFMKDTVYDGYIKENKMKVFKSVYGRKGNE